MLARDLAGLLAHLRDDLVAQIRASWSRRQRWLERTWAARPPHRRIAAQGLAVALALLGLGSLDARGRLADRLPSPLDWRALEALLERDARPGDLVGILPPWLDRARQVVPARLPVLASSAIDTEWLPGVRRVWLVAADGVASVGPRQPLASRASASVTQQVGRLRVTRIDLAAPVLPLASMAEQTGTATRWREIDGVARRCMELPTQAGPPVLPEPPPLRLGAALSGHVALLPPGSAALARLLVRLDGGPPVAVEVSGRSGWQPFRVDTLRFAGTPRLATVEAEGPAGAVLCVEALVLP